MRNGEDVQSRMRVKVSKAYLEHAQNIPKNAIEPNPILKIVMPDVLEISDLSGETDPSNQNRYSPLPGLLHKYEMLLAFVAIDCSSHCRYCYRLDLFNGSSNKSKADMRVVAAYIKCFNQLIDEAIENQGRWDESTGMWLHRESGEPLIHIREILFSGGDPMTLPNATIARQMALMAEAGIKTIRIGTKELVFNPARFDGEFWEMMDLFHQSYPEMKMEIIGHYSHPFELIEPRVNGNGAYLYDVNLSYKTREDIKEPLRQMRMRGDWIGHHNQFPIIAGVNDHPEILRLLLYQTNRLGIVPHNIYACREIPGNKHFRGENSIEAQYWLVQQAKVGLSGIEKHAPLVMSTEYGKTEVIGVKDSKVFLNLNRFIHGKKPENTVLEVDLAKLPEGEKFYWLTENVIADAVDEEGQKTLQELGKDDGSLIKQFKKIAATKVSQKDFPANENEIPKFRRKNFITIEIIGRKGGSELIQVDLSEKRCGEKQPTLATILAKKGVVEAACGEQLSCSTCVGEVTSDGQLPETTEDELDVIEMGKKEPRDTEPQTKVRATCQIQLKPGQNYRFAET